MARSFSFSFPSLSKTYPWLWTIMHSVNTRDSTPLLYNHVNSQACLHIFQAEPWVITPHYREPWPMKQKQFGKRQKRKGGEHFLHPPPHCILRLHLSLWCIWQYDISSQTDFALLFYYICSENRSFFIIFCNTYILEETIIVFKMTKRFQIFVGWGGILGKGS